VNGEVTINGNLTIDSAGAEGIIQSSTNDVSIGPNGTLSVSNSGNVGISRSQTGGSVINAGLLILKDNTDGSVFGSPFVNMVGATLQADQKLSHDAFFAAGSFLAPGGSPGCLTFQEGASLNEATVNIEIEGATSCEGYDQLIFEGATDITEASLVLSGDYAPAADDVFIIGINNGSTNIEGAFQNLPEGTILEFNDASLQISYNNGGDITLTAVAILPLDLLAFTGEARDKTNLLTWRTANEEDFSHFEIERSTNGTSWAYLGEVAPLSPGPPQEDAQRTGPGERSYGFEDVLPLPTAYYRLKMIDLDGTFAYSELVYLENNLGANAGTLLVYPNPSTGHFTVDLSKANFPADRGGELRLVDLHGREIWTQQVSANQPT
ncbi:MAG: hypothetical protein AAGA62_17855, partial [Bacteroidota bacterium]